MFDALFAFWLTFAEIEKAGCRLADLERFPSRLHVIDLRQFSIAHVEWLEQWQFLDLRHAELCGDALREARKRFRAWDVLDDAQRCNFDSDYRLGKLRRLREIIGEDAYGRGKMPFPIAEWFLHCEN